MRIYEVRFYKKNKKTLIEPVLFDNIDDLIDFIKHSLKFDKEQDLLFNYRIYVKED